MSWETMYDRLEQSHCACGKGLVTRQSYMKMDDWNRTEDDYYNEKIKCQDCETKYHIEHYIRYYPCPSWKGDGKNDTPYLIPNGMTLAHNIEPKHFSFTLEEEIVSSFEKDILNTVIDDMTISKYSTRLKLSDSKSIVELYYRKNHKRSLPNIITLLQKCVSNYSTYEWAFSRMQEYKTKEKQRIENNTQNINDVISKSVKLEFYVC